MLELRHVSKRLGTRQVLDDVALSCQRSEIVAILGSNGAGKSTLLRIAAGIVRPDSGDVFINGASVHADAPTARRKLGYVPDTSETLLDLMVCELVHLVARLKGVTVSPVDEAMAERLGVLPFWRQRLGTLSFGQRKRAHLLSALLGDPWLLLLDEPSNGLDPSGVALVTSLLVERASRGLGALLTTNEVAFLDTLPATRKSIAGGHLSPG